MTNDYASQFQADVKGFSISGPRPQTISFVRQFARVYINLSNRDASAFVLN